MDQSFSHGDFCWVDLNSRNMTEAKDFYQRVFGWTCDDQETGGPPYGMFQLDGQLVAGVGQMSDEMLSQDVPSIWNSYVLVDDCQSACSRAVELGGGAMMEPMKVMDAGTMAFLHDPAGAMFAAWQPDQHHGAQAFGQPGAACWNELATRQFDGALDFYRDLLGWTYLDHEGSPSNYRIVLNGQKQVGGIMEMTEEWDESIPAHWSVYFQSADAEKTTNAVKEAGGQVCHGPFDAPNVGRIAICGDPFDGMFNVIELNRPIS
jgi:predicted enzyme related to lactoylglutathione lyase